MLLVGIAGGSGSGKTTFAKKVQKEVQSGITLLHMDSYYLSPIPSHIQTSKGHPNFDHPDAFDWDLLHDHLSLLKQGLDIESPVYDFSTSSRKSETTKVQSTKIIIFEGILTLHDARIRELLDIKCFLSVDSDIRFIRRLHRDIRDRGRTLDSVVEQYYETVRPMHNKFLEPQQQYADFIVGEETSVAASILSAKLNHYLDIPHVSKQSYNETKHEDLRQ